MIEFWRVDRGENAQTRVRCAHARFPERHAAVEFRSAPDRERRRVGAPSPAAGRTPQRAAHRPTRGAGAGGGGWGEGGVGGLGVGVSVGK